MIVKGIVSAVNYEKNTVDVILPEYNNIVITPVNKYNSQTTGNLKVNDFVLVIIFNNDFNDTLLILQTESNNGFDGTVNGDLRVSGSIYIGGKELLSLVYPEGSIYTCVGDNSPANLFGGRWELVESSGEKRYWKRISDNDYDEYTLYVDESGNLYLEGDGVIPVFEYDESTGNLYTDSTQKFEYNEETGDLYLIG